MMMRKLIINCINDDDDRDDVDVDDDDEKVDN